MIRKEAYKWRPGRKENVVDELERLREENERLRNRVAELQAELGYKDSIAAINIHKHGEK